MDRRCFFVNSAIAGAAAATFAENGGDAYAVNGHPLRASDSEDSKDAIAAVPLFCAHEHWGSLDALGATSEGFRADMIAGAVPVRDASVWDIVLDPYFNGWLFAAGHDAHGQARTRGYDSVNDWWRAQPEQVLTFFETPLRQQHFTGAFQCIRQGISLLHGVDILEASLDVWEKADAAVKSAYNNLFPWYGRALTRMNVSEVIRPVHPEFFLDSEADAEAERAVMRPIMRVDPLLELWPAVCPRRDRLAEATDIEPRDAASWRAFITALFDLAEAKGNVGIKQLQAYTRSLDFVRRADAEVTFSGDLNDAEKRVFQDWVMHQCCSQAHERGWPHQIHTGTHNLAQSSPTPLAALAACYPRMNLVLLHCWPFLEEAAFMAKHTPNVYLDACWQTVLNPAFLEQSLSQWLGYMPSSKVMCSQDATSVEMAAGSAAITRELLSRTLTALGRAWRISPESARACAADILHNNAVAVYGVGTLYEPRGTML